MGLTEVRKQAIAMLRAGTFQHEARDNIDDKNLLATGVLTPEQVIKLLLSCKGTQYERSRHHEVREIDVHIFKPQCSLSPGGPRFRWYIKLYFLAPDAWFISVHKSSRRW